VAYRASAYAGHGESYMSLDKAEDDQFVNVNFGGRLDDTRMGWVPDFVLTRRQSKQSLHTKFAPWYNGLSCPNTSRFVVHS
jgi:hypothetical protein